MLNMGLKKPAILTSPLPQSEPYMKMLDLLLAAHPIV